MGTKCKALLVTLLVLAVIMLSQLACTDVDGSVVTVKSVVDDNKAMFSELGQQLEQGQTAVIDAGTDLLTPRFAK
jgi:regulator of RNase E activity RraA